MDTSASVVKLKPSGKFSPLGMGLTLLVGMLAGVGLGLAVYALEQLLSFSIPIVVPIVMGAVVGGITSHLGSRIGRCRNPLLAVTVGVIVGMVAGVTGHVADYYRFRSETHAEIQEMYPDAAPQAIEQVIDLWLADKTGQRRFIGYMLLRAQSTPEEITAIRIGAPVLGLSLRGPGLIAYWLVELVAIAWAAAHINAESAREPYCERCNVPRRFKTPVVGTEPGVESALAYLAQRDIPAAVAALRKSPDGNVARLEVEYCPVCYDSFLARLVVVEPTGPTTWLDKTVWQDKLEPEHVRTLMSLAG